ncbi:hypothetical protein F5890DRAFT_1557835 [Lentinula detonsa]|uniref:Uncharacterized protein n=1 Tax=Lentinula detonsa TaxID=2804962 RepID=A0AA38UP47_9AGAR|nr:hypothetical protein F5890DRAFT_1557835 [Lentinula detonsa]
MSLYHNNECTITGDRISDQAILRLVKYQCFQKDSGHGRPKYDRELEQLSQYSVDEVSQTDPSGVRKPGPFHLSPEGGLYLTHRLENAEAMARLEFKDCVPVHVNGFLSKFMVVSYNFDDTGLNVMDLDNWHWYQHDSVIANLPNWWDIQSLRVIPQTGVNAQNKEIYERYLSSHVVIGQYTHSCCTLWCWTYRPLVTLGIEDKP